MKIVFITPYPKPNEQSVEFSAMAKYSQTLINMLLEANNNLSIEVLAQTTERENCKYVSEQLKIHYCWKYGSYLFILNLINKLKGIKKSIVHFQQEIYEFGPSPVFSYLFILVLVVLKIKKNKIVTTIHGIIPKETFTIDFSHKNKVYMPLTITRRLYFLLIKVFALCSNEIIVHNDKLRHILTGEYGIDNRKIITIPHFLYAFEKNQTIPTIFKNNKDILNKKIVLFFGHLATYKGLDVLVNASKLIDWSKLNACLLIAGSVPSRFKNNKEYINWLQNLKNSPQESSNYVIWDTRYIPDNELKCYFDNATLVVMPYTEGLSASGPLTYAVRLNKAVLASHAFNGTISNKLIYGSTEHDLATKITSIFTNPLDLKSLIEEVKLQHAEWKDKVIVEKTMHVYTRLSEPVRNRISVGKD